jgi:hypothetical protein
MLSLPWGRPEEEAALKIAILATAMLSMAASPTLAQVSNNSAKKYAPGQQQNYPGQAKKYAPGQQQKYPGQAKKFAPGQEKMPETTGRGGANR